MDGLLLKQPFPAERFVGFFQVRGEFCVHFFFFTGIEREAGEALADEFLPIRHGPPS
jgi:hypothetical protein